MQLFWYYSFILFRSFIYLLCCWTCLEARLSGLVDEHQTTNRVHRIFFFIITIIIISESCFLFNIMHLFFFSYPFSWLVKCTLDCVSLILREGALDSKRFLLFICATPIDTLLQCHRHRRARNCVFQSKLIQLDFFFFFLVNDLFVIVILFVSSF